MNDPKSIRAEILKLVTEYHQANFLTKKFNPGKDKIHYAGRVFDDIELKNAVEASLDFWLTEGRFSEIFIEKIASFLNVDHVLLTNSGSSANLIALATLTSEKLGADRLKPGDEIITVAAGFPSTVTPVFQYGLVPVFVDVDLSTGNADIRRIEQAISPKTRGIFLAHTLGNPFEAEALMNLAHQHKLWVIEDNCDAFGSHYKNQLTGTFGHISTISFYPAHHITTGEGGAVITNDPKLAHIARAFRDWGRDCYCSGGENNTCGKRFSQQFGNLPKGYDHKYVYSEVGYNLKMTDLQAAIGAAQMDKLEMFCSKRKKHFQEFCRIFSKYPDVFSLPKPTPDSDPAWFAFLVTVSESAPFTRNELIRYLEDKLIETRNLFAGNLIKQPAFLNKNYRISESLKNTEIIMNQSFFMGTYPGMTQEMFDYIEESLDLFMVNYTRS